MEARSLAEEYSSIFIKEGGYHDAYEAFKATSTSSQKENVQYNMNKKRRWSVADSLGKAFGGEEEPWDVKAKNRIASLQRRAELTRELQRIRRQESLEFRHDRYHRMVKTWHSTIKAYMSPEKATLDWMYAWRVGSTSKIGQFVKAAAKRQGLLLSQAKYWLILRCLLSLMIYSSDFLAAFMLAWSYIKDSQEGSAIITLTWPFLALIIHGIMSIADGESLFVVIASLFGMKPFIDVWRVITDQKHDFQKKTFPPEGSLAIGRAVELVFESVPQTCTQVYLMIQSDIEGIPISSLQYVTVITSLAAIGFITANLDFDIDTSAYYRKIEPKLHGWVPDSGTKRVIFMILHSIHMATFAGMRIVGIATLASSMPWILSVWISADFAAFTCMKFLLGTYWVYAPAPKIVSHICNALTFVMVTTLPCFYLRNPLTTVCGFQYQVFRYYTGFESVGMVLVSMHLQNDEASSDTLDFSLKMVLIFGAISSTAAYLIKFFFMKKSYNWMWWSRYNVAQHFSSYVWVTYMYDDFGPSMDDHRACALVTFDPKHYLHDSRVKNWLREKWPSWQANPPLWFDEKFKRSLHPSVIPKVEGEHDVVPLQESSENGASQDTFQLFLAFIREHRLETEFMRKLEGYSNGMSSAAMQPTANDTSNEQAEDASDQESQPAAPDARTKSRIMSSVGFILGVETAPDASRASSNSVLEKEAALPAYLKRIRKGSIRGGDGYFENMVRTWTEALKTYVSADAAMDDFTFAWRLDENSNFAKFLHAAKESQRRLLHQAKFGLIIRCLFSAIISYFDLATDVLLAYYYFTHDKMVYGGLTIAWPLIVVVCQALIAWSNHESWSVIIASLFGLKPLIDTYRFASGSKVQMRQQTPVISLSIGRAVEAVFESVPQTGFQVFLVLLQKSTNVSVDGRQYFTIVSSLIAIGFIAANTDYDLDTNEGLRRVEPKLYGWIPESKSKRLAFIMSHACHLSCYVGMRIISYASLALVSPIYCAAWVSVEFATSILGRKFFNTYAFFKRIPTAAQHVMDILFFISMGFIPIYILRNPYSTVCGRQFTITFIYNYIASFAMVSAALHINQGDKTVDDVLHECLKAVGIFATVSAFLSFNCAMTILNKNFNHMWWSTLNPARHFSEFIWNTPIYEEFGYELDDHRAFAIAHQFKPGYYLHDNRVKAWVHEMWASWEADPPLWFDDDFKRALPQSLIPAHARRASNAPAGSSRVVPEG